MWDYEHPYPGGAAVTDCQLPRPLYFPGNPSNKTVSADGIDCKAVKRILARGGRWPWDPDGWDFAYSKNIALGSGPNVINSGVAGYQRQMGWEGSGQVGEKTFNSWRNARIPDGLPNAGQPLMDATAINMMEEAWLVFKGNPTAPLPPLPLREQALDVAISQIGVKESPPESNRVKYSEWYGMIGAWCAMFVTWCYETQGDSPAFVKGSRYAYVPYVVSDAQNARYGLTVTSSPIPGDLVAYDWDGGEYDHIGIFEDGSTSSWSAIEGNTSTSNNSNGGQVMRRSRSRSQVHRVTFVRVREP